MGEGRTEDDEERLVERAARGDASAVEELLHRHLPRLKAWVRMRCGPRLLAQESSSDVVQSICRDVLQNFDRFRYPGEAAFRAWLYATAARKVADRAEYWRAERRDPGRIVRPTPAEGDDAPDVGEADAFRSVCSPSAVAMGRETMEAIERAFARLGEPQREIILLARLAGLTHVQIAERLGIGAGAARMRLFRALGELAEALKEEGVDG